MADRDSSAAVAPNPPDEPTSRRRLWAVFGLPILVVTGVLAIGWFSGLGNTCGGPVPGCGALRNAGSIPVTVRGVAEQSGAVAERSGTEVEVAGGERVLVDARSSQVRVDPGQCLVVDSGPLWNISTVIDRSTESARVWHPIDDWGARVRLHDGECQGGS